MSFHHFSTVSKISPKTLKPIKLGLWNSPRRCQKWTNHPHPSSTYRVGAVQKRHHYPNITDASQLLSWPYMFTLCHCCKSLFLLIHPTILLNKVRYHCFGGPIFSCFLAICTFLWWPKLQDRGVFWSRLTSRWLYHILLSLREPNQWAFHDCWEGYLHETFSS